MTRLKLQDCVNAHCPWSGKPVREDSLARYKGHVVGFCNTECRDKFFKAIAHFEKILAIQISTES